MGVNCGSYGLNPELTVSHSTPAAPPLPAEPPVALELFSQTNRFTWLRTSYLSAISLVVFSAKYKAQKRG